MVCGLLQFNLIVEAQKGWFYITMFVVVKSVWIKIVNTGTNTCLFSLWSSKRFRAISRGKIFFGSLDFLVNTEL